MVNRKCHLFFISCSSSDAFPIHRLGSEYTLPSQAHRHSSRYLPGSVSASAVTSATHPPPYQYAQHLQYHSNRHQSLRRSRPHHQRSMTAPHPQGRSQSPLPFPPASHQISREDRGSGKTAKAVAWQDPPATMVPSNPASNNGPSRSFRNRQRELPNIKGFVGYM